MSGRHAESCSLYALRGGVGVKAAVDCALHGIAHCNLTLDQPTLHVPKGVFRVEGGDEGNLVHSSSF